VLGFYNESSDFLPFIDLFFFKLDDFFNSYDFCEPTDFLLLASSLESSLLLLLLM
jgi:hypothetical protein